MTAAQITEQYESGLISRAEALDSLNQLARNHEFSANYSDTLEGYKRFEKLARDARRAYHAIQLLRSVPVRPSPAFTVRWKRQGEWVQAGAFDVFTDALRFARKGIRHGGITERIEVHDGTGALRTVYDCEWPL